LRCVAGYNPRVLLLGHAHLVALVVLVTAFVALHPYLDKAGLCGFGGCPEASQQSSHAAHTSFSTTCLVAVLAASGARALAFTPFFGRCRATDYPRPTEVYLSPDPPPPRVSPSR
jgi:hypothetical protein